MVHFLKNFNVTIQFSLHMSDASQLFIVWRWIFLSLKPLLEPIVWQIKNEIMYCVI